jgi:hypothetical protein
LDEAHISTPRRLGKAFRVIEGRAISGFRLERLDVANASHVTRR